MISRPRDATALAASAESLVERVFGAVQALRERVLASRAAADARQEPMRAKDIAALRPSVLALLDEYRDTAVGMGMIVTPGFLPDQRRRLEWWQYVPAGSGSGVQLDARVDR